MSPTSVGHQGDVRDEGPSRCWRAVGACKIPSSKRPGARLRIIVGVSGVHLRVCRFGVQGRRGVDRYGQDGAHLRHEGEYGRCQAFPGRLGGGQHHAPPVVGVIVRVGRTASRTSCEAALSRRRSSRRVLDHSAGESEVGPMMAASLGCGSCRSVHASRRLRKRVCDTASVRRRYPVPRGHTPCAIARC